MKTRKEEFIAIGRVSCFIVETIIRSVQVGQNAGALVDPAMLRHIDLLAAYVASPKTLDEAFKVTQ